MRSTSPVMLTASILHAGRVMRLVIDEDTAVQIMEPLRHVPLGHEMVHVSELSWKRKKDLRVLPDAKNAGLPSGSRPRMSLARPACTRTTWGIPATRWWRYRPRACVSWWAFKSAAALIYQHAIRERDQVMGRRSSPREGRVLTQATGHAGGGRGRDGRYRVRWYGA
jgi:hypothetical protein